MTGDSLLQSVGAEQSSKAPNPCQGTGGAGPTSPFEGNIVASAGMVFCCALIIVIIAASLPVRAASAAETDAPRKRIAVLDIELLKADYLPDAHVITTEERHRLDLVAEVIRERLAAEGYAVIPQPQTKAAITAADPGQYLHRCNGCERRIARRLGADWVAVGWVQFVSYLILNLNVVVVDVDSGAAVGRAFVDLRGNTERSWRRATTYMLEHILVDRLAASR